MQTEETCWLPTFDWERLPKWSFVTCIIGQRGAGKTTICENFLYHTRERFTHVYLVSGTVLYQDPKKYFPMIKEDDRFTDDEGEMVLNRLFNIQLDDLEKNNNNLEMIAKPLVIFDDILGGNANTWGSKMLMKLTTTGRHIGVSAVVLTQSLSASLSPTVRQNIDIYMVFRSGNMRLNRYLVETFLHFGTHNKKEAYATLNCAWLKEPYTTIVCQSHLIGSAVRVQDFCSSFKADLSIPKRYKLLRDLGPASHGDELIDDDELF